MKKIISILAVLAVSMTLFTGMSFGEDTSNDKIIYSNDFEACEVTSYSGTADIFNTPKGNAPSGINGEIGEGNSGAIIISNGVGGSKSLRLMRVDGGVGFIRVQDLSTKGIADGAKLTFAFDFRYEVLGNYGFTAVLSGVQNANSLDDYGGEIRNILSAKTDTATGKDSLFVVNPDGSANRILATDELKANTDYNVKVEFTMGSEKYDLYLNGKLLGTYTYVNKMTSLTGFRIDCHDWCVDNPVAQSQPGPVHINNVCFDNMIVKVENKAADGDDTLATYKISAADELWIEDFETLLATDEFEKPDGDSANFSQSDGLCYLASEKAPFIGISSQVKVIEEGALSDSYSPVLKDFADLRFWNVNYSFDDVDSVCISMTVSPFKMTAGYIDLCVTDLDDPDRITNTENQGGVLWRLRPSQTDNTKLVLSNPSGEKICEFGIGEKHTISAVLTPGTDEFIFFVDGDYVKNSESQYIKTFNGITGIRIDLSGAQGSEVAIDDIIIEDVILKKTSETPSEPTEAPTEAPTSAPTAEPTEAPTSAPTAEPEATAEPTPMPSEAPAKSGCGSIISGSIVLAVALMGIALTKKH